MYFFDILFILSSLALITLVLFFYLRKVQKAQLALIKQGQEDMDFVLKSGGMGTWDLDLRTQKISCSDDMLHMWGIDPKEFKGTRFELQNKVHPEDIKSMKNAIESAIKEEFIYELEYRILPQDDVIRWIVSRGRYTLLDGHTKAIRFSGVVFDITDRKNKEEELQRSRKIRDQFFMIAGHELKTPVTSLQLIHEVNKWELNINFPEAFSKEKIQQSMNKQQKHLERINNIINQLLDEALISKGQFPLQRTRFDFSHMVIDLVAQLKVTFESSGVEVSVDVLESVKGNWDRFRLEQALLNLLTNANRYGAGRPVNVEVGRDANNVYCTIKDQGIGLSPENKLRVFEKFFRVNENETRGFGLGLFITRNIILAHGGEISLESELNKWTTFTISLPIET